jgi:sarcosine oxidase gamma subunit
MADDDVLELGADGTFEIPSPKKKPKPAPEPKVVTKVCNKTDDSAATTKAPSVTVNKSEAVAVSTPKKSVLDDIGPGEFKVYRAKDNKALHVIVRVEEGQTAEKVEISENKLYIGIKGANKEIVVDLPQNVRPETASSKTYKDYVTIEVSYS